MVSVAVDVDDTLIDTQRRTQGIWLKVLGREIPLHDVETLGALEIFEKHASPEQKPCMNELRRQFTDIQLCKDDVGIELVKLDEPVPYAADALRAWSKQCTLVYLTGRPETLRDLTLSELRKFGFPMDDIQLVMFNPEDWEGSSPGTSLADARSRLFSSVTKEHDVVRVIDDFPGYFPAYRQFGVPERIGLLRLKLYSPQDYFDRGATRVVESWKELQDDPPRPRSRSL